MPRLRAKDLPEVAVTGDIEQLEAWVRREKFSPETLCELAVYLTVEKKKTDALEGLLKEVRAKIESYYSSLAKEQRDRITTKVGMITYTPEGEKVVMKDRDFVVENLTPEQIRITYKPDMAALETILKKADLARLTETQPTPAKITVRPGKNPQDYEDIET